MSKSSPKNFVSPEEILAQTAHRPFPLPDTPWFMCQQWCDLLFSHWAVEPRAILPLIPQQLELDLFDGKAWIAVTPFRMTDLHLRGLPAIPGAGHFLEMNLRTYVRVGTCAAAERPAPGAGKSDHLSHPGIFFFSLDASNLPAVVGARMGFGLPYFWSDMSAVNDAGGIHYTSSRKGSAALVDVTYTPIGEATTEKSELERFLTERYCLYETRMGAVLETQIHHVPWSLQKASATFTSNTLGQVHTLPISRPPDLLHFSKQLDVLVYPPEAAQTAAD